MNATDVNSELPDQDVLAAFANSALGSSRRRRRQADAAETAAADSPAPTPGPDAEEPAPVQEMPGTPPRPGRARAQTGPTPPEFEADPQDAGAPSVPTPTRTPETETGPAAEGAPPATGGGEVDVRAVAAPMTRTAVPPALQGGPVKVRIPNLGPAGARATQCTIMASQNVRERFAHYQLAKKMAGEKEPSNALVVRRAFLYCKRGSLFTKLLKDVYHQQNAVDDEDYDEDGFLGEVVGRRAVRGRLKDSGQQSFRPSEQELANYDAFTQAYGFPSRSDFLNAVLDEFLPQLPSGRRK